MGDEDVAQGEVTTLETTTAQTPVVTETLTRIEHEAAVAKAKSDALADVGRLRKSLEENTRIANAAMTRLKEIEEENYRRQEIDAQDDPTRLSEIRRERRLKEKEAEVADKETRISTQLQKLLQVNAKALSSQYNVTDDILLRYAGEDADKMEELAKSYGERKGKGDVRRMTQEPDSGKTTGGGAGLTREDIAKMSPEEVNRRSAEIAKLKF